MSTIVNAGSESNPFLVEVAEPTAPKAVAPKATPTPKTQPTPKQQASPEKKVEPKTDPAAPKKSPTPKKAAPKPAPKPAAAKKAAPKAATKSPANGDLRKPQLAILAALAKSNKPLTRKEVSEKSGVDPTKIGDYTDRPEQKKDTASRWPFPDLVTLKYVRADSVEKDGRDVRAYTITAAGRKAIGK